MTALEYIEKQIRKHTLNYARENARCAPIEVIHNIELIISHYKAAAEALRFGEVVRCKDCRFWLAEDKERCKKMGADSYGWCLRDRNLDEMDWREHRYQHDFCSRGKKKGMNDDDDSDCD